MRMFIAALAAALACAWGGLAEAQVTSAAARGVLDAARNASGGAAWNALRGLHETGTDDGVAFEAWRDPVRYGARTELATPAGRRVQGFNGQAHWRIDPDRTIRGGADQAGMAQARTAAFFGAYGFFYPSRFAANTAHLGVREARGRAHDVVRVEPMGGEARELWFDRRTRLLARMVDRTGGRPVTTEFSDYRRVGRLLLPFKAVTDRGERATVRQVQAADLDPADRARFSWTPADGTFVP